MDVIYKKRFCGEWRDRANDRRKKSLAKWCLVVKYGPPPTGGMYCKPERLVVERSYIAGEKFCIAYINTEKLDG